MTSHHEQHQGQPRVTGEDEPVVVGIFAPPKKFSQFFSEFIAYCLQERSGKLVCADLNYANSEEGLKSNDRGVSIVLHKLSDDLAHLERAKISGIESLTAAQQMASRRLASLQQYLESNPQVLLYQPLEGCRLLTRRDLTAALIDETLAGSRSQLTFKWGAPPSTIVWKPDEVESLTQTLPSDNQPFIMKTVIACGVSRTHEMWIARPPQLAELLNSWSPKDLSEGVIIQPFLKPVDGSIYKVYVIGDRLQVRRLDQTHFWRAAISALEATLPLAAPGTSPAPLAQCYTFNSSDSTLFPPIKSETPTDPTSSYFSRNPAALKDLHQVSLLLRQRLQLDLIGFDVLAVEEYVSPVGESKEGSSASPMMRMYVVDVNYFPGYKDWDRAELCPLVEGMLREAISIHRNGLHQTPGSE